MADVIETEQEVETEQQSFDPQDQYLTFLVDKEEYGVSILSVQEIRGWEPATVIPNSPSFVRGVINLRGTVVPIVDLRERFGMPSVAYGPTTVVIVLAVMIEGRRKVIGIVVDAVSEVYNFAASDIQPAPDMSEISHTAFIQGLGSVDDKMVILLDLQRLLAI